MTFFIFYEKHDIVWKITLMFTIKYKLIRTDQINEFGERVFITKPVKVLTFVENLRIKKDLKNLREFQKFLKWVQKVPFENLFRKFDC